MELKSKQNMTLLEALSQLAPDSSKSKLREWLKHERVTVDGQIVKVANAPLQPGQVITVHKKSQSLPNDIKILYEDKDLIVVDKPAGLLSVAKENGQSVCVHSILKNRYAPMRVYPVHRLDRDTSGVMLFALNEEARDLFKTLFEKHQVNRIYRAVVEGHLKDKAGTWESYLYEDANLTMRVAKSPEEGKKAITHYREISRSKKHTLLEFELATGRKNQIRVQAADAGHPIVGDKKYGAKSNPIGRMGLHAIKLLFTHPRNRKVMTFESPLPETFSEFIQK